MPKFFSLRLSHKVGAIGAVGVLGLLTVGAIFFAGNAAQNGYRRTAETADVINRLSNESMIALLDARRAEKDFLLRSDDKYAKRHGEIVRLAAAKLDALATSVAAADLPDIARRLVVVRQGFETYVGNFTRLVEARRHQGLDENSGLQGTLRKSVHDVEDRLASVDDARLKAAMLMMRRHEKDFILRGDTKYRDELLKSGTEFAKLIAASELAGEVKRALSDNLDSYRKDFVAWTEGTAASAQAQRAMSEAYAAIEPEIDALQKDIEQVRLRADAANEASRTTTEQQMAIAIGVIALVALVLALLIGRAIAKPLSAMTRAMRELANGNFDVVLPGLGRHDEVGEMAQAVEGFKSKAVEKARREAEEKSKAEQLAVAQRRAEMHRLADGFDAAIGEIVKTVSSASTELEGSATSLAKTAESTQKLSTVVAAASEEASTNVQSVASASEQMAASVTEIGRQVQESSRIANEAVDQARRTDDQINKLSQAAGRIGDVTQLITTIAEQTNLLALNATIEAARAGEAGRGFAVVAQEVKALASQTAKATGEISGQIAAIQSATQDSVVAIKEISGTIGRISEIATTIASAVEEQGAATLEITRNVQQAAEGTTLVAANITDVNRGAAETGAASSQVLSSAQSLANEGNRLRLEVDKFLLTVRAA
ncbi:MAG TPA: HAMP domain-containing methyl-accepting chemotaxis protein [Xanthobacteraceae bacterium]